MHTTKPSVHVESLTEGALPTDVEPLELERGQAEDHLVLQALTPRPATQRHHRGAIRQPILERRPERLLCLGR